MRTTEVSKSIQDEVSAHCEPMRMLLERPSRPVRSSVEQRKALQSQAGHRFRATDGTGTAFNRRPKEAPIEEEAEYNDIIQSYRVEDEIVPRMRMKWMTPLHL